MANVSKIEKQKLKILIPTDFSGHALNAGFFAIELLKNAQGEFILENVFQVPKGNTGTLVSVNDIIIRESLQKLKKEQEKLKAKYSKTNIIVQSEEGNPVTIVKQTLKKDHIDLLVIGHNLKIDRFSSSFIAQPEYWPTLLVPESPFTKIGKEAIIVSTKVKNGLSASTTFAEISKRFKGSVYQICFEEKSTAEELVANILSIAMKHKTGMIILKTTNGDRLEQAITKHHLDSVFLSYPTLLISGNR